MKSVQMMMMIMMMVSVSAGPLPPSLDRSRHDDQDSVILHLLDNNEHNFTRPESRQDVNITLDIITGNVTSNSSVSVARPPFITRIALYGCFLSTCATNRLTDSLQVGDEMAGSATSSALGYGKK